MSVRNVPIPLSRHAEVRQQQRGIRKEVLDCLLAYGRREHDHSRCEIVFFDAVALQRVARFEERTTANLAAEHREVYAVVNSEGHIVTTGHRFRRILRDKSQSNLRPSRSRRFKRPGMHRDWGRVMVN